MWWNSSRNRFGKRRAEDGDRRGEDDARLVAVADLPDRLEQVARAVEVDAIALLEVGLGLAGDDRREVEDDVGPARDEALGDARRRQVRGFGRDREGRAVGLRRRNHVDQRDLVDGLAAERLVLDEPVGELDADHAGGADDENVHCLPHKLTRAQAMTVITPAASISTS